MENPGSHVHSCIYADFVSIYYSEQSKVIPCVTMQSNLVQSVKVKCGGGPETKFVVY